MFRRLFGKKTESSYKVSVPALSLELDVPSDVPILEHALTKGIAFPHSCRVGTCGTCKCRLVSGKIYELSDKAFVLSARSFATTTSSPVRASRDPQRYVNQAACPGNPPRSRLPQ